MRRGRGDDENNRKFVKKKSAEVLLDFRKKRKDSKRWRNRRANKGGYGTKAMKKRFYKVNENNELLRDCTSMRKREKK